MSDFVAAVGGELPAYGDLPVAFPSYRFDVSSEGGEVIIDGRGWGHGRGMSQWGAYGKARRGWEAADILAAYYAGIRPEPLPEELRGQPIRVAVGSGRRSGAVTPSRPFRVVDGEGTVLAAVALGRWRVAQEKGRLRVSPPEGFGDALAVKAARVHPGRVVAGAPAALRFELAAPAFVTVRVRGPGAPSEPVASLLLDAGEAKVGLPRLRYGGQHVVVIEAEAGPGRRVKTTVAFRVQGQSVYGASLPEPAPERQAWVAVACLLAVGVAIAGWAALPRVRPSPSRAPR